MHQELDFNGKHTFNIDQAGGVVFYIYDRNGESIELRGTVTQWVEFRKELTRMLESREFARG